MLPKNPRVHPGATVLPPGIIPVVTRNPGKASGVTILPQEIRGALKLPPGIRDVCQVIHVGLAKVKIYLRLVYSCCLSDYSYCYNHDDNIKFVTRDYTTLSYIKTRHAQTVGVNDLSCLEHVEQ